MSTEWEKIDQLFHQALECPNEQRAAFIARAAQHDPALRRELQSLLNVHEENHSFLETPVMRVSLSPEFGRWQGQIGRLRRRRGHTGQPRRPDAPADHGRLGRPLGHQVDGNQQDDR